MNYTVEEQRIYDKGYNDGFLDGKAEEHRRVDAIAHKAFKIECTKENPCEYCRGMEAQHGEK